MTTTGIIYPFTTEAQDLEKGVLITILERFPAHRVQDQVKKVTTGDGVTLIHGVSGRVYVRKATDLIPSAPADPEARRLAVLNSL